MELLERATLSIRSRCKQAGVLWLAAICLMLTPGLAGAQFSSGSSGIHGSFPPAPSTGNALTDGVFVVWNVQTGSVRFCSGYTLGSGLDQCDPGASTNLLAQIPNIPQGGLTTGVYEFTSFTIPSIPGVGRSLVVVGHSPNTPLSILSQSDINIPTLVSVYVRGWDGPRLSGTTAGLSSPGGRGGPGGFDGGASGNGSATPSDGNAGFGPSGGSGGLRTATAITQTFGSHASAGLLNPSLSPLTGGSGGGGAAGIASESFNCESNGVGFGGGPGGGGGGGLLLAASGRVVLGASASIIAIGGNGGFNAATICRLWGGAGTGGNVRIVAQEFTGTGAIQVSGGLRADNVSQAPGGFVRIETAFNTFTGSITGASGGSFIAFPTAPIPATQPLLRITSVGGTASPTNSSAKLALPDITFSNPITTPTTVEVAASNVPVNTTVTIKVVPASGTPTTSTTSGLTGSTASSTATATVTLPPGAGVITATATFNVADLVASLGLRELPLIDGQQPQRVEVAAMADGTSRTFLVAESGARFEWGQGLR